MLKLLACTFHALPGQEKGWVAQFELAIPTLKRLYDAIYVSATPLTGKTSVANGPSPKSLVEYLRDSGLRCQVLAGGLGDNHRAAINMALKDAPSGDEECRIHYCDFDRILVWATYFSNELERLLKMSESALATFPYRKGIKEQAFAGENLLSNNAWTSHPLTQKATEIVINCGVNRVAGYITSGATAKCYLDPLGTSQITSPQLTKAVVDRSHFAGFPQAEWVGIIICELFAHKGNPLDQIKCAEVDGLTFETLEILKHLNTASFPLLFPKMFSDIEGSKDEAYKRISIAEAMLQSFADALAGYDLLDNKITELLADLTLNLQELKRRITTSVDGHSIRNVLEDYYLKFSSNLMVNS